MLTSHRPRDPLKGRAQGVDDPRRVHINSIRVVVVDDDPQVARLLGRFVRRQGHAVRVATTGSDALDLLEVWPADLVIADLLMPEMDGIELMERVSRSFDLPVIAISGGGPIPAALLLRIAEHLGATAVLTKPFSSHQLAAAIETALGR